MTTRTVRILLSKLPLFQSLSGDELEGLVATTRQVYVSRGEVVFKQGDPCHGFHAIVYGRVKLVLTSPAGDKKVVRLISADGTFGEALMFMDRPYIVSALTLEDTMLLHVNKDALFAEMERRPQLGRRMMASLSHRLHSLMSDVEAYSLRSGTQRVIGYLLNQADHESPNQILLPIRKSVIASRLNLTPEHFSRILRELSDEDLVRVKGREISILDMKRLLNYRG